MQLVYSGKTKEVYRLPDGNYRLRFKDDVTGTGPVFDPGANTVGPHIAGAGRAGLLLSKYFFERLAADGLLTHYLVADTVANAMTVLPAAVFGRGIEVICRYRAYGSFLRRYGMYAWEGQPLEAFVEFTLKDDARQDPPIDKEALVMLGLMTASEYDEIKLLTRRIAAMVKAELARRDVELYDIKLEFGRVGETAQIALIDEISGGNMRAVKDGAFLTPLTLAALVLGDNLVSPRDI